MSCGHDFVLLWVGQNRIDVFFYSLVLYLSLIIPLTNEARYDAYRASNKQRISFIMSTCSIIINLFLTVFLLLVFDAQYAVWACVIGTVVPRLIFSCIISPIVDNKLLKLPTGVYLVSIAKDTLIMVLGATIPILLSYLLRNSTLILAIKVLTEGITFIASYFFLMIVFERPTLNYIIGFLPKRKNKGKITL